MTMEAELAALLEEVRKLPPMTEEQREIQRMSWAWGNLACTTNHKPRRNELTHIARSRGWTEERFQIWADEMEWWDE